MSWSVRNRSSVASPKNARDVLFESWHCPNRRLSALLLREILWTLYLGITQGLAMRGGARSPTCGGRSLVVMTGSLEGVRQQQARSRLWHIGDPLGLSSIAGRVGF